MLAVYRLRSRQIVSILAVSVFSSVVCELDSVIVQKTSPRLCIHTVYTILYSVHDTVQITVLYCTVQLPVLPVMNSMIGFLYYSCNETGERKPYTVVQRLQ